jgi:2-polyprenyl-6-methoxyphenol hydroxylase-like FAD-dependent oxidoreductase
VTPHLARPGNDATERDSEVAVLIVGAGPTGLALAAQLQSFGTSFRIIDRARDRARESRALAIQARTLELFQSVGLAEALVANGNTSARLMLHFEGGRHADVSLGGFGATDTRFPFILFISQAETEAIIGNHLTSHGVTIERGVELSDFVMNADAVDAVLQSDDGQRQHVRAKYLVGCDGAHSTVRKKAGIPFEGDAYLQDFMLGDVEADATSGTDFARYTLHSFGGRDGTAMFFPLGHPATWRVIAMSGTAARRHEAASASRDETSTNHLSLAELQAVVDGATGGTVALRDPAWLTHFRLHHRQAARYRAHRVFLAGDAGHIHSPVGAQGMNTGIQDAWNLGWKLALVSSGVADPRLLDSYEAERWPVGRALLRYTDRIFGLFTRAMSSSAFAAWVRRTLVARVLPRVMRGDWVRRLAFRSVSELSIRYRSSPAVMEGAPQLKRGPRAGDRLPDAEVTCNDSATTLQRALAKPAIHLLLCGTAEVWAHQAGVIARLRDHMGDALVVHRLTQSHSSNDLFDPRGETLTRLGVSTDGQYLVRPDGYIAYRCGGHDLTGVEKYLQRWFPTNNHITEV